MPASRSTGKPMGRPSKINRKMIEDVCNRIKWGCTFEIAAQSCKVSPETLYAWKVRGKERPDTIYGDFLRAAKEAEAIGEAMMVGSIAQTGAEGAKWVLSRRIPERWGDKTTIQLAIGKGMDEFLDVLETESEEVRDRILAKLASLN